VLKVCTPAFHIRQAMCHLRWHGLYASCTVQLTSVLLRTQCRAVADLVFVRSHLGTCCKHFVLYSCLLSCYVHHTALIPA
jgi:hypothetical protein